MTASLRPKALSLKTISRTPVSLTTTPYPGGFAFGPLVAVNHASGLHFGCTEAASVKELPGSQGGIEDEGKLQTKRAQLDEAGGSRTREMESRHVYSSSTAFSASVRACERAGSMSPQEERSVTHFGRPEEVCESLPRDVRRIASLRCRRGPERARRAGRPAGAAHRTVRSKVSKVGRRTVKDGGERGLTAGAGARIS